MTTSHLECPKYRKDGKTINYPIDAAVRRNIMTSIGQTTGKMQLARTGEWGYNYMEVTSHFGARPSHAEWQVHMINGSDDEYKNLAEATKYGTGEGLKGWNCRQTCIRLFREYRCAEASRSTSRETKPNTSSPGSREHWEREVRQLRHECAAANGLGNKAEFTRKSMELKDKEAELKDFIAKTNRTQTARVSTAGYNRIVSRKVNSNKPQQIGTIDFKDKKSIIKTSNFPHAKPL